EETVLRVGHAYEQATDWRDRRPALVPDVQPARLAIENFAISPANADPHTLELGRMMAQQAGFALTAAQVAELDQGVPYIIDMVQRLRRPRDRFDEPAKVVRFPAG